MSKKNKMNTIKERKQENNSFDDAFEESFYNVFDDALLAISLEDYKIIYCDALFAHAIYFLAQTFKKNDEEEGIIIPEIIDCYNYLSEYKSLNGLENISGGNGLAILLALENMGQGFAVSDFDFNETDFERCLTITPRIMRNITKKALQIVSELRFERLNQILDELPESSEVIMSIHP